MPVFGAISVVAGVVVLPAPLQSIVALVLVAGALLVASGLMQLVRAFSFGRARKTTQKSA